MQFEIELKTRLDDCALVKERLFALGEYSRSYTKSDSYWVSAQMAEGLRLRHERGIDSDGAAYESVIVTSKHKKISDGIEVNDESEFAVSSLSKENAAAIFETLLRQLGMHKDICKEKQGWAWIIPKTGQAPILAELSLITGLGWFLELEIIAADNNSQTVEESRSRLLALLEQLEIPADRIEARPYTVMLKENQVGINNRHY